jgi:hypothetical protein
MVVTISPSKLFPGVIDLSMLENISAKKLTKASSPDLASTGS